MVSLMLRSGCIDAPISRKDNSIIERCVSINGQFAKTYYEVIKEFDEYSLVNCILETGRTHQIRVHMAYMKHSLLGDSLYNSYNNACSLINRQALHSYKVEFIHPITKEKNSFKAEIPNDIKKLII